MTILRVMFFCSADNWSYIQIGIALATRKPPKPSVIPPSVKVNFPTMPELTYVPLYRNIIMPPEDLDAKFRLEEYAFFRARISVQVETIIEGVKRILPYFDHKLFYLVGLGFVLSVIYSAYKYKPSPEAELLVDFPKALVTIKRWNRAVFLKHLLVFVLQRKQGYENMADWLIALLGVKYFTSLEVVDAFVMLFQSIDDELIVIASSTEPAIFLAKLIVYHVISACCLDLILNKLAWNHNAVKNVNAAKSLISLLTSGVLEG